MLHTLTLFAFLLSHWGNKPVKPEPQYLFRIYTDNVPADSLRGISTNTKTLSIRWKLDETSAKLYPELVRQPIWFFFKISLARGMSRVATIDWTNEVSLNKPTNDLLFSSFGGAQAGDRLIFEVHEIKVKNKDQKWQVLTQQAGQFYQFGLY